MATQLWSPGFQQTHKENAYRLNDVSMKEYFRDPFQCCIGKASPASNEPFFIHGLYDPSWGNEAHREKGLHVSTQARHGTLREHRENVDFVAVLRDCGKNKDLYRGTKVHDDILKRGLLGKFSDALITMYARCGALAKAKELLDLHKSRNVFTWTALITAYARLGQAHNALKCFDEMQRQGLSPDAVTFSCILKVCGSVKALDKGQQIHDQIARQGLLEKNVMLGNILVDMYVKCGSLAKAKHVLEKLPSRDVVSWNALITGYTQEGQGEQALSCFNQLQNEGLSPNAVTFASVLKACGSVKALDMGEQIHDEISRQGLLGHDTVLGNALVDMYAKCGSLAKAQCVLDELPSRDVITWSALIGGYVQEGQGEQALTCFSCMQREGVTPNAVTFACVLKACGIIGAVEKGEEIHDEIAKQGLLKNNVVLGTALVDMYAKCGALKKARQVLDKLSSRNVVSWSALITGFSQQSQGEEALSCFEHMQREGLSPNAVTYASILKACGTLGAVDKGEKIHDKIARKGLLKNDIVLGNALVDMYAKCGALVKARQVLEKLPDRNVISWNALIAGYAQHGQSEQALKCLEQMRHEGLSPNAATFSCMLNACSYSGLVEDGHMYFLNMSTKYGMKPHLEHYTCMVNLFGCAGHLDKAVRVIQEMSCCDSSGVWFALLGACQKWGEVNVGRWAFEHLIQLDKVDATAYILMANIYAAAGMQEDAKNIEVMRMENGAWKRQGLGALV